MGSPKHQMVQGDRAWVVISAWESHVHGEARQGLRLDEEGTRDAESRTSCDGELPGGRNKPGKPSAVKAARSVWERGVGNVLTTRVRERGLSVSITLASPFGNAVTRQLPISCAPCHASQDPWCSQEELGGKFLGHSVYLEAKAEGESSILRKPSKSDRR